MLSPRNLLGPCCVIGAVVVAFGIESLSDHSVQAQDFKGRRRRDGGSMPAPQTIIVQPAPTPTPAVNPDQNKDAKPADQKQAVETVKRPDKPEGKPGSPEELKALKPDKDGKIRFNFKGQQWVDVLNWLADISEMQLDWQEVPGKTVDLTTRQSYTIDEARDTINRMLRDRGFTLVRKGEVLSVVNLATLDPGVLPRVQPEELKSRDANEFVKVSFQLDTLLAKKAVDELKPMCSPQGKLTALEATNRLEAVDSVVNLREIYRVLQEEQSQSGKERLVKNFPLKYTRAADIKLKVEALLGMDKKSAGGPMSPEQMQQMQQQAAMRMQQMAQGGGKPGGDDKQAQVFLVANDRDNSIMANGPADRLAIVSQAISLLDQPVERTDFASKLQSFRVYRLSGLDPDAFVQILNQQARLDPTTQLEVDKVNNAVFASASPIDHGKIKMLVDTLDGSGRKFKVIRLRRLPADYLAGTLQHMINGDDDDDKKSSGRRSYYWGDYGGYGGRSQSTQKQDKFRVEGDVEGNRLMIRANEVEERLVDDFLVEMGELPPPGGNRETVRRIEIAPGKQTEELLEKLQRAWPSIAPNELKIAPAPPAEKAKDEKAEPTQPAPVGDKRAEAGPQDKANALSNPVAAGRRSAVSPFLKLAQLEQPAAEAPAKEKAAQPAAPAESKPAPAKQPAAAEEAQQPAIENQRPRDEPVKQPSPIIISRSPKGELIIESKDPRALDLLEDVIAELAPSQDDFKYYPLKYADCFWISSKLEDYFKEDDKKKNNNDWESYYYGWGGGSNDTKEKTKRLSGRKPLKFIWEDETNSIIVQGGTPDQWTTVDKLIKIWDQREPKNAESARKWKNFQVKYSKAKVVAETIKEVYRDLLSESDKALQNGNQNGKDKKPSADRIYTYIDTGGDSDRKTPVRFKGLLSVGIDEISNSLIVSAPDWLMKDVEQMITHLDNAARPSSTVQVLQVDRRINSVLLQKKLSEVFGKRGGPGGDKGGDKNAAKNGAKAEGDAGNNNANGGGNRGNKGGGGDGN